MKPRKRGEAQRDQKTSEAVKAEPAVDFLAASIAHAGRCIESGDVALMTDPKHLSAYASAFLDRLCKLSEEGDIRALAFVLNLLNTRTKWAHEIAEKRADLIKVALAGCREFPLVANRWFFKEPEDDSQTAAKKTLRSIGVIPKAKRDGRTTVETQIAQELHNWLSSVLLSKRQSGIPFSTWADPVRDCAVAVEPFFPLTRANYREWWKASKRLLPQLPQFSTNPPRAVIDSPQLQKYRQDKSVACLPPNVRDSKAMDNFMKAVCRGFRSIAPR